MKRNDLSITIQFREWSKAMARLIEIERKLDILLSNKQEEYISPAEACKVLGITRTEMQRKLDKGEYRRVQPGGKGTKVFIKRSEIEI